MVVFVTYREGGTWTQLTEDECQKQFESGVRFAALRVGNWIYDFVLQRYNCKCLRWMDYQR